MKEYKLPMCDCGESLYFRDEEITAKEFVHKIIDGKRAKTRKMINRSVAGGADNRLKCIKCGKEYILCIDGNSKIIKGEEWY